MKNQLIGFLFLFICSSIFGQKSFVIEYDKISENTFYFEKIKGNDRLKPVKAIFPRKGDHVQLIVKNVNPFIYKVNIDINEEDNTPTTSTGNSELFSLLGNLAMGTDLSFVNYLPGSRGEGFASANKKMISDIHNQLITIQGKYELASSSFKELLNIMKSESMPVDSIRKKSLEIISTLENENQVETLKNEVKFLEKDLNSLQPSDIDESNLLSYERALINELSKIIIIKKSDLERLKEILLASKSEVIKKHTVGYSKNESYSDYGYSSSSNEVSTDIVFKVNIINNNYLNQLSKAKSPEFNQEDYIEYYNVNRWKNEHGLISDEFCDNCKPILLATGYIKPDWSGKYKVPSSYLDLLNGEVQGAYGEWKIYDGDENVINSFMLSPPSSSTSDESNNYEEEQSTEIIRVKCQESNAPKWSSGLFLTNPLAGRSQFSIVESFTSDSLMILQEKTTNLLPSIGATLSFQPLTSNLLSITYNLGLSVNTFSNIDENKINLLGGVGLSHRDWKYFSISAGACLSRTSQLKNSFHANTWYNSTSTTYNKLLYNESLDAITQDVFKLGYYIGFHFNF